MTNTTAKPWDLYTDRQRWTFLAVLFLIGMSASIDRQIIGVLLEPIKREFQVSDAMLGLMSGFSFAVFYATLGIPVARWADRGNRRLIVTLALAIWSVMTAACGMVQSFAQLALARIGVGAGEAGCIPPAQSLIADYFPPERRAKALGIFMMSSITGYVIGVIVGGQITQAYGWRAAFLALGLPGVGLAIVAHFFLSEPRSRPEFAINQATVESLSQTLRILFGKRCYVQLLVGMVLYSMMVYGAFVFSVAFLMRAYDQSVGQASAIFGGISAVTGIIGSIGGGALADRLARKDAAWLARLPALAALMAWPVYELAFGLTSLTTTIVFLAIGGLFVSGALPAIFASLHVVCGGKRRATSVAIVFFFGNLLGIGLGPLLTGFLSDMFAPSMGSADGLRYAMMIVTCAFLPAGFILLKAAGNMARDSED